MAGTYDGSLVFDTKIDTKGFKSGTNTLKTQANGMKSTLLSLGKTIGIAFGVTQLIKFGKQAVELASDIQEVQNVVDTAFGDMAYKMEQFADIAIEMYGISELTAKQTGSTFMAMAKGMDIANESASDISLQLTALSADMASFYNKSQEATSTALKSVFTGETETLKQFGIVMTEANLESFRLAQGIETSYKNMSQAEKVALRYNYVMNATKLAQGDFAKTQDSWANQTRILSERWKEFLGLLGNGLIKVLTPLIQVLNTVLQYLISFATVLTQMLGGEAQKQQEISASIGGAVDNQKDLTKETEKTAKANKKTLASFDEIQKLTANTSGAEGAGAGGGANIDIAKPYNFDVETGSIDAFSAKLEELKKNLLNFTKPFEKLKLPFDNWVKNDIPPLMNEVKNLGNEIFNGLSETLSLVLPDLRDNVVVPILNTILSTILPLFTQIGTEVLKTLTTAFNTFNKLFQNIWSTGISPGLALFTKIWSEAWNTIYGVWQNWGAVIFENLRLAIENAGAVLQNVWDKILQPVWQNFMETVDWLWTKHLQPLLENFLDFVGEVVNGILEIYNKALVPLVNYLIDKLSPIITTVINTIVNIIGTAVAGIIDLVNSIITVLKGLVQFIVGVFTLDWEKAWEGVKTIFSGLWDGMKAVVKTAVNFIIDLVNHMISAVIEGINYVIKAINKLSFDVPDWVPGIGGETFGFDLNELNAQNYKIPKLATGTVVPANYGNFLATLGDNKRAPEIVSPLPTMKQAFMEALAESGQNITIKFEESSIGDLVRLLKPYIDKENRRVGTSMRLGGAY